jgi:hypothetical protein
VQAAGTFAGRPEKCPKIPAEIRRCSAPAAQGATGRGQADLLLGSMKQSPSTTETPSLPDRSTALEEVLEQLRHLEREYWQGWQSSEQSARELKFLDGVQWCIERRMRLLQLEKLALEQDTRQHEPIDFTLNLNSPTLNPASS